MHNRLTLRYYQQEAVDSIFEHYRSGNKTNPLVVMPTGTGKSVVIAEFCRIVLDNWPGMRILILTHSKELIVQNHAKLQSLRPEESYGIFSSGIKRYDTQESVVFAGIQSVYKKASAFEKIDAILIDECHMISPTDGTQYQTFFKAVLQNNPNCIFIGLTATPYRLGQGLLTDSFIDRKQVEHPPLFGRICYNLSEVDRFNRLIAEGYLSPIVTKATETYLDIDNVKKTAGDFNLKQLEIAVDKDYITKGAIAECLQIARDRKKWLVFCSGVNHSKHVCDELNINGISAKCVFGNTPDAERDSIIEEFKNGEFRALVNYGVLTTGFDVPDIDFLAIIRATQSTVLWVQMVGRGMRIASNKRNCLVADFGRNCERLGPVNNPTPPRKSKGGGSGMAPVKTCPKCRTIVHASIRICDGELFGGEPCQYEFPITEKIKSESSSSDIIDGGMPIVELFKVDSVSYGLHAKKGKAPCMSVSYYCGLRRFREYVLIEHPGFGRRRAVEWWGARTTRPLPASVSEALSEASGLRVPQTLRVWVNKRQPEILSAEFSHH